MYKEQDTLSVIRRSFCHVRGDYRLTAPAGKNDARTLVSLPPCIMDAGNKVKLVIPELHFILSALHLLHRVTLWCNSANALLMRLCGFCYTVTPFLQVLYKAIFIFFVFQKKYFFSRVYVSVFGVTV